MHTPLAAYTALHWACQRQHLEVVSLLLEASADTGAIGQCTPLMVACRLGSCGIADLLLQAGADVNKAGGDVMHPSTLPVTAAASLKPTCEGFRGRPSGSSQLTTGGPRGHEQESGCCSET